MFTLLWVWRSYLVFVLAAPHSLQTIRCDTTDPRSDWPELSCSMLSVLYLLTLWKLLLICLIINSSLSVIFWFPPVCCRVVQGVWNLISLRWCIILCISNSFVPYLRPFFPFDLVLKFYVGNSSLNKVAEWFRQTTAPPNMQEIV